MPLRDARSRLDLKRRSKMLYADSYMNRQEFREMFDHRHYDAMKEKYDPLRGFPEVYEKTCKMAAKTWNQTKEDGAERAGNLKKNE